MNETSERVLETLQRARLRLTDPAAWAQTAFARKANGTGCRLFNPEAVAWCLRAAVGIDAPDHDTSILALDALVHVLNGIPVVTFNDAAKTTHQQVLRALDRAVIHVRGL